MVLVLPPQGVGQPPDSRRKVDQDVVQVDVDYPLHGDLPGGTPWCSLVRQ